MRIFNWVHRRLIPRDALCSHQNLRKDDEESEMPNTQADAKALLDHDPPTNYLNFLGLNKNIDGGAVAAAAILSIGTFGLLKDGLLISGDTFVQEFGFLDKEAEDEDEDEDNEEQDTKEEEDEADQWDWKPLQCDKINTSNAITDHHHEMITGSNHYHHPVHHDDDPLINYYYDHHEDIGNKSKKERITLADLFSAESDHHQDHVYDDDQHQQQHHYYSSCGIKALKGSSTDHDANYSSKKKLPANAQFDKKKKHNNIPAGVKMPDSRPIQKLHGMQNLMDTYLHWIVVDEEDVEEEDSSKY